MKISVVIDNFNYAEFLKDAIDSVLHQTFPAHQIIVVDDGSVDASREILAEYEGRVKAILQENRGQTAALSRGVEASSGDAICFLDSDDVWLPNKLAAVASIFESHSDVEWIRHKLQICDAHGRKLKRVVPRFKGSRKMRLNEFECNERLAPLSTSALSMRRALAHSVFQRPPSDVPVEDTGVGESKFDADAYILASMNQGSHVGYSLDAILCLYRRHSKQQFTSSRDLIHLIKCQIAAGEQLQRRFHPSYRPTHIGKHRLIELHLQGKARFGSDRRAAFKDGLNCVLNLRQRGGVNLASRQFAKLTFAFLAPSAWVKKLLRQSAYALTPAPHKGGSIFKRESRAGSSS